MYGFVGGRNEAFELWTDYVFAAFGGGFTWGAIYLKWAYNS